MFRASTSTRTRRYNKRRFCCELWFPETLDRPVLLSVYYLRNGFDDYLEVSRGTKNFMRNGALDRGKMLAVVSGRVKQWKVQL